MLELNQRSNQLKIAYFFNLLISALTIILNTFYEESISILMDLVSQTIFYLFIIITSFISISQILFLALISERLTHKLFYILVRILIIYLCVSLITSIPLSVFYYTTNNNYPNFYMDCPFNYHLSDIEKIINSSSIFDNNINIKCNNKICVEMNKQYNHLLEFSYLCNFNSNQKNVMYCNKYIYSDINNIESEVLSDYINFCKSFTDFYICETDKKPNKYYIDYNYICPTKKSQSFILGIILSIFNIITPLIIFVFKFILYKKILQLIFLRDTNSPVNLTDRKTDNSSKIKNNNIENEPFEERPLELIIVENISKKSNQNKNNKSTKSNLCTRNETTENIEVVKIKKPFTRDNIVKGNNGINVRRKNNSFDNCQTNHLELNNVDMQNGIKLKTESSFYKDLNKQRKKDYQSLQLNIDENSEVRFIKIIK